MLVLSIPQCHRFVEVYLSDPDATRAADAIGFEEDAEVMGARMLNMPQIAKRIAAGMDDQAVRSEALGVRQAFGVTDDAS